MNKNKEIPTDAVGVGLSFVGKFLKYCRSEWLTTGVLIMSATQTYALVNFFAPKWAFWLPFVAISLMEGGYMYWRWREYEADLLDGNPKVRNAQEWIANIMCYITLGLSVVTMLTGAVIEIGQSQMAKILPSDETSVSIMGWIAISGIFILAGLEAVMDWQYKRNSPLVVMERGFRAETRRVERDIRMAELEKMRRMADGEVRAHKEFAQTRAEGIGYSSKRDEIEKVYPNQGGKKQQGNRDFQMQQQFAQGGDDMPTGPYPAVSRDANFTKPPKRG